MTFVIDPDDMYVEVVNDGLDLDPQRPLILTEQAAGRVPPGSMGCRGLPAPALARTAHEQRGILAMAVSSFMVPLGAPAPDFALPSVDGATVRRADFADASALLVAFMSNHCPYVRHVEAAFAALTREFPELAVVAVCSNDTNVAPDDSPADLRAQVGRTGWEFPYLIDADQSVATAYRAACTPDFYLYDAAGRLAYRGSFDDSTPGNRRPVTGARLRAAVVDVLAGRPVPEPHHPSMGCSIKWTPGNEPA
jgi:peroxiredoxin